jgi:hypothetical protein
LGRSDIWAEIFHDKNGETVLRNISSSNSETKLEAIDFEETYFEVFVTLNDNL